MTFQAPFSLRNTVDERICTVSFLPVAMFSPLSIGPLKEGWRIQRDTPGYGPRRTAEELRRDLAAAKRYADQ
jgi:hypothetical protein